MTRDEAVTAARREGESDFYPAGIDAMVTESLGQGAMSEPFHIAEYNSLKAEILLKMKQIDDSFRFMLIAVAASMSWTLTNYRTFSGGVYVLLFFIPLFISLCFTIYIVRLNKSMQWRTEYIREVEKRYADDGTGWENSPLHKAQVRKRTSFATALSLILTVDLITAAFAAYMVFTNTTAVDTVQGLVSHI